MSSISQMREDLNGLLTELEIEHKQLDECKEEISNLRSTETMFMNNIRNISKSVYALQHELDDYLEK